MEKYKRTSAEVKIAKQLKWLSSIESGKLRLIIGAKKDQSEQISFFEFSSHIQQAVIEKIRRQLASELNQIRSERGFYK